MGHIPQEWLAYVAAPMINQSDLPFRTLCRRYNATLAFTQMLESDKILNDQAYLEFHLRDLTMRLDDGSDLERPVVVQLCGDDTEILVQASRKLQNYTDFIDFNIGCPQEVAMKNHYGAYLLGKKDWPLIEDIVSQMSHSLTVPVSAKLRLCQPVSTTADLAERIQNAGASLITLHARTVSMRNPRHGAARLEEVQVLKERLSIPVLSNGNVKEYSDIQANMESTGADGVMVAEALLDNPCLFANIEKDPIVISLEYLDLCRRYPEVATVYAMQKHVQRFVSLRCERRPWFKKFRTLLGGCMSLDEIESLLKSPQMRRWRGKAGRSTARLNDDSDEASDSDRLEAPYQHGLDAGLDLDDLFIS